MKLKLCLSLLSAATLSPFAAAQVVLNEFSYDDQDADDREFIELHNASGVPVDISGWTIDCGDSPVIPCQVTCTPGCAEAGNLNPDFTIPPGTILVPGGYWLIGNSPGVPGVNQVIPGDSLEDDEEWITLKDGGGAIVDTVSVETNKNLVCFPLATLAEGPGIHGNHMMVDGSIPRYSGQFVSVSRLRNGRDTNNNGRDFGLLPWTPGASNDSLPASLTVADDFDVAPGTASTLLAGTFVTPVVIDPTSAGPLVPPFAAPFNPAAIPASPQGGNALVLWDPMGGGNAGLLLRRPTDQVDVQAFVYFEANPHPTAALAQYESWSLGLQGSADSFGNHPDPAGFLAANGVGGLVEPNTGVAWSFLRHTTAAGVGTAVLYLVDENDGGTDETVLATIPITVGVNDGWQRLRLRVNGAQVEAWFGGTMDGNDGSFYSATLAQPGPGDVYFQYREFVLDNADARPLTIDDLRVGRHGPGLDPVLPPVDCAGSGGCAPRMGWNGGTPSVSSPGPFGITCDRGPGGAFAMYALGLTTGSPWPIDIGSILGGGPCWSLNDIGLTIGAPMAGSGPCNGLRTLTLPNLAGGLPGGTLFVQSYVFPDPGSPLIGLPLVVSDTLSVTLQP